MQRYTIKQIWRSMEKSDQGEFVRYDDVKEAADVKQKMYDKIWDDWLKNQHKLYESYNLSDHLYIRVQVLFIILMTFGVVLLVGLIERSLGL